MARSPGIPLRSTARCQLMNSSMLSECRSHASSKVRSLRRSIKVCLAILGSSRRSPRTPGTCDREKQGDSCIELRPTPDGLTLPHFLRSPHQPLESSKLFWSGLRSIICPEFLRSVEVTQLRRRPLSLFEIRHDSSPMMGGEIRRSNLYSRQCQLSCNYRVQD